jgi:hypothetical protein
MPSVSVNGRMINESGAVTGMKTNWVGGYSEKTRPMPIPGQEIEPLDSGDAVCSIRGRN